MEVNKVNDKFSDLTSGVSGPVKYNWKDIAIVSYCILIAILIFSVGMSVSEVNNNVINVQSRVLILDEHISKINITSGACALNSTPEPTKPTIDLSDAHKYGTGKVQLVVYSDFQCPYCERGFQTLNQLKLKYPNDLTIYFKHFPLTQIHPYAQKAAEASECASDQNKFWEYHDKLFVMQSKLTVDDLKQYAKDLNLSVSKFDTCLDSGSKASKVSKDQAEGLKAGVQGTPTFLINGEAIVGAQPIEVFEASISSKK